MQIAHYLSTLRLAKKSATPLFRQLYDAIKSGILDGQISPGTQLPPTRELAQLLGISRQTLIGISCRRAARVSSMIA